MAFNSAKDGSFNHQGVEGTQVPVRYNPFDLGEAFAFVLKKWVRCISEHYAALRGRTERELQVYATEKRQEKRKYGQELPEIAKTNAIRFLSSDQPTEKQALQRQRDLSSGDVMQLINGQYSPPTSIPLETTQVENDDEDLNDLVDEEFEETKLEDIEPYENDDLWQL